MALKVISNADYKEGKMDNARELASEDEVQGIIIQDQDSAIVVVVGEDTLLVCDAVYHNPVVPWDLGKEIIVVKDNFAQSFIIIQDRDGARALRARQPLVKDVGASVVDVTGPIYGVRNLTMNNGTSKDFNSDGTELSPN